MNANKNKECLFICTVSPLNMQVKSGGVSLARSNYEALNSIYSVTILDTLPQHKNFLTGKLFLLARLFLAFFNYLAGNSPLFQKKLISILRNNFFDLIFIDHSQLGGVVEIIKKTTPKSQVFLAFQNIEFDYFGQSQHFPFGLTKVIKRAAYYNENRGLKNADKVITLTQEDSLRLYELYGRSADKIIPITIGNNTSNSTQIDFCDKAESADVPLLESPYILFCGSYFGPNINGIKWFIENVLPHIKYHLIIIGFQMEKLDKLNSEIQNFNSNKIKIIGTVPSVAPYYQQAAAVINPVDQGAGMNTKSVEALAYGKPLITTDFAIRGFPNPLPNSIFVCKTAEDFIQFLNLDFEKMKTKASSFNKESFAYYQMNFTLEKRIQALKEIL